MNYSSGAGAGGQQSGASANDMTYACVLVDRLNNRVIGVSSEKRTGSNSTLMAAQRATESRCGLETSVRISVVLKLDTCGVFRFRAIELNESPDGARVLQLAPFSAGKAFCVRGRKVATILTLALFVRGK